jgi:hypothetical protein
MCSGRVHDPTSQFSSRPLPLPKIHTAFYQSPKDSKFRSILTLKFPSHAANILGGDGDEWGHGLLQGEDRGGRGMLLWMRVLMLFQVIGEMGRERGK